MKNLRIGTGYDLHRIEKAERGLFAGGIRISGTLSAIAHSDGDVLIHALIDALTGACGFSDIGELFPDNENRYKGIDSSLLLENVIKRIRESGHEIISCDSVLILQEPKISPFKKKIRENLSKIMMIEPDQVNIKAKTKENVDAVGAGLAYECHSVALVRINK